MIYTQKHFYSRVQLKISDKYANITNPSNEKGNRLQEEVDKIMTLSKHKIVAPTEEDVSRKTKFQCV